MILRTLFRGSLQIVYMILSTQYIYKKQRDAFDISNPTTKIFHMNTKTNEVTEIEIPLLWTDEHLAKYLGMKNKLSIQKRVARGLPMPPTVDFPHIRGRRYLPEDVIEWAMNFRKHKKKRGRPTKTKTENNE